MENKTSYTAPFITLEGIDGSGKSTHIPLIKKLLEAQGFEVLCTHEPGGTNVADKIRKIFKTEDLYSESEALLAFACRNEHLNEKIWPALGRGEAVICDRFTDSTYAYQVGGSGIDETFIEQLEKFVQKGFKPDLTLYFEVNYEKAAQRTQKRGERDKFDAKQSEYFAKTSKVYRNIAALEPGRMKCIDSDRSIEEVAEQVEKVVGSFLRKWKARHEKTVARQENSSRPRP